QSLVGVRRRHPNVDHRHVRSQRVDGIDEAVAVAHRGDHLATELFEQPDQTFSDQCSIVCDNNSHGTSATITVGPPVGESIVNSPSTARNRSARPARPRPLATCAPPTPSSPIARTSDPSVATNDTEQAAAPLCLATFVRDSAATK